MYRSLSASSLTSKESLEDILVKQYRESIFGADKETHSTKKYRTSASSSPYSQSVVPKNIPYIKAQLKRPMSAKPSIRKRANSIESDDKNAISRGQNGLIKSDDENYSFEFEESDESEVEENITYGDLEVIDLEDKTSEVSQTPVSKQLSASAQAIKYESDTSKDFSKPIFQRKNITIICYAYKNGSLKGRPIRLVAPNLKQLLEAATSKLRLNAAARRLFLSNGEEIFRPQDIPRDAEVFISQGEPYIDSMKALRSQSRRSKNTINPKVRPPTRKGLNKLTGKRTMRVVIFRNGDGTKSYEVNYDKPLHYARDNANRNSRPTTEPDLSMYMSEKKKRSVADELEQKHKISYEKFLDGCTQKLSLTSRARYIFDWKGCLISHIKQVERFDFDVAPSAVYGPVWISKCESFNPVGSHRWMSNLLSDLKSQLHGAKQGKRDLELLLAGDFEAVSNPNIFQLEYCYIEPTKDKVENDIMKLQEMVQKYKSRLKELSEMVENHGNKRGKEFVTIQEIDENSRLLEQKSGLRIRIYDNGSEELSQVAYLNMRDIQRGTKDEKLIRSRFLEALTAWHKPKDPTGPARSRFIRKLFNRHGEEILNVLNIRYDDEVWVSYGEEFRPLFSGVLSLTVEQVKGLIVRGTDAEEIKVFSEGFNVENLPANFERPVQWRTTEGFPSQYKLAYLDNLSPAAKAEAETAIAKKSCSVADHFLLFKDNHSIVLRPQVNIDQKTTKKLSWPSEGQNWVISQNGTIYSRAFPNLALCVNYDNPISVCYKDRTSAEGFSVTLKKKTTSTEVWSFTPEGNICPSRKVKQLVLTYLEPSFVQQVKEQDEFLGQGDAQSVSDLAPSTQFDSKSPLTLAVLEKFKSQNIKSANQRWAMKQENYKNSCQWRQTKVSNPQWRKLAYSWPVLPNGNWNKGYKWPMQGNLLPNAPSPLKRRATAEESSLRLKVFKNGESDKKRFVSIVAPDLSGMERSKPDPKAKVTPDVSARACAIENLVNLELSMFLEQATSLLGLNSAARRLFDENGKELFSLRSLKRDQVVYVSCGDWWIDPSMTKAERQRRQLLGKLTHDVAMIKAYCDIRDPTDLAIEVEKDLVAGSRLILRNCILSMQEKKELSKDKNFIEKAKESDGESDDSFPFRTNFRNAHEISHEKSDKKLETKKYSWQQIMEEESVEEPKTPKRGHRPTRTKKCDAAGKQKFLFSDGYICSALEPNLVLGVLGIDLDGNSSNVEVTLCQKSIDDPSQRWEMTKDGFIRMKCSSRLVLGVAMPAYKPGSENALDFEGCTVTVQNIKEFTYGRANQRWIYDPVFQNIFAFQTSVMDKEITAANHVSICTAAVIGSETICQDGYTVEVASDTSLIVCSSCAKVMRGRFQLIKSPEKLEFVCALGSGRKTGQQMKGSFSCLNGKVDLSTYEAETTLQHWSSQLEKLRQETSFRSFNREIHSQTPFQACRVLAMRNGEGRLRSPELIIGTSIAGILDQCTQRLGLSTAARRMYTADGMHVLHMEQLIEWAVRHYYDVQKEQQQLPGRNDYEREEPEGTGGPVDGHKQEESTNSREGTPDHTTAEAGTKVTTSDISKSLRPPSGRKSSLNKPPPSRPSETSQEVPLSVILRTPIEVWVSCGENFIRPATAERLYETSLKAQMNRNANNLVLDTEKHTLRHMQGRRYKEMSPTSLKATAMPESPILVEGGWLETTKDEAIKLEKVHKLEERLAESRPLHSIPKTKGIDLKRELYAQSDRKRVLVYRKGDSPRKAQYVWGESIAEILSDATSRLGLHRKARSLFNERGQSVTSFELIERDSLLCVTSGDSLKGRPKHSDVRMKANWARALKQCGPDLNQINVAKESHEIDLTNVDPFGPPVLTNALEPPGTN